MNNDDLREKVSEYTREAIKRHINEQKPKKDTEQ